MTIEKIKTITISSPLHQEEAIDPSLELSLEIHVLQYFQVSLELRLLDEYRQLHLLLRYLLHSLLFWCENYVIMPWWQWIYYTWRYSFWFTLTHFFIWNENTIRISVFRSFDYNLFFYYLTKSDQHKMNEQITLQLGSYSNYVGSHFWNFQDEAYAFLNDSPPESISENCNFTELYRFKRNAEGSTTGNPRALIFEHRYISSCKCEKCFKEYFQRKFGFT